MRVLIFLVLTALAGSISAAKYEGYKIFKVHSKSDDDNRFLLNLEEDGKNFIFGNSVNKIGKPVFVMVSPGGHQVNFEKSLSLRQIDFQIVRENVQTTIDKEREYHDLKNSERVAGRITFDQFYRHDEINAYLAQLAEDYPDTVTVETIGQSYEGRDLNLIHISDGSGSEKPRIFVDAGIHAREWITPEAALYLIYQLVENEQYKNLTETVDWIVLPSVNPDGYEFTWDEDRFWRKTVSKGVLCDGVDANRNFGFHWDEAGGSDNECTDIYSGPVVFSEVESQALRDFLLKTQNVAAYISLHSCAETILYPYAYGLEYPDNKEELVALAYEIQEAIAAVQGRGEFEVGSPPEIMYSAAGASMDWAAAPVPEGAGIGIVYTIELSAGPTCFDVAPEEIDPFIREGFEGIKAVHNHVAQKLH